MYRKFFYKKKIKFSLFNRKKKLSLILRKCSLKNFLILNKHFLKCEFYKSSLEKITFENCKFLNSVFSSSDLNNIFFKNCEFKNVEFSHTNIKKKIFQNCKFEKIKFNLVILDGKNNFPVDIINKNKDHIVFNKNGKLIHNKKIFQFIKNEFDKKRKTKNYFYNSNVIECDNNDPIFDKTNFSYKIRKFNSQKKDIIQNLISGNGFIKVKTNFNTRDLKKAENLCIRRINNKKKNDTNKLNLSKAVVDLYSLNPVFSKLLPSKKYIDIISSILGNNFYSGYYGANVTLPGAKAMAFHIDYPYSTLQKDNDGTLQNFSHKNPINIQSLLFLTDVNDKVGPTYFVPGIQLLQLEIKYKKIFIDKSYSKMIFKHKKKWFKFKIYKFKGKRGTMYMFNGLNCHSVGDNFGFKKNRISINNQFLPNYIRPMYNSKGSKLKNIKLKQLSGLNFVHPLNI